ncbi:MAG: hypothetical protein IPO92_03150 [Saprospiraceae bacterium]|nr:hypothetical protein [Saprospiraceae bacterium]
MKSFLNFFNLVLVTLFVTSLSAQVQYTRAYDQTGINVFEPSKIDNNVYDGLKLKIEVVSDKAIK